MNFTEPRRLTNLNTRFTSIAFSPDGDRIAFACEKRRRCLVGVMNRDGSNLIEVAGKENARDDTYRDLHFSPDGTFLVGSVLEEDGEFSDVLLIDLATKAQTRLTHGRKAGHPALSPDGSCMVFEAWRPDGTDLWRLDREGGKEPWATATRLIHTQFVGTEDPEDQAPRNAYPSWSPDGAEIAFLSSALTDKANQPLQVGLIRPDGSDIRYLTETVNATWNAPVWHPSGKDIAFTVHKDLGPEQGRKLWKYRHEVHIICRDGKGARCLKTSPDVNHLGNFRPDDGRFIVYSSSCGERFAEGWRNWDIRMIDVETLEVFAVTNNDWYDGEPQFSPDGGSILFVSERNVAGGMNGCDLYSVEIVD